MDLDTNENSSDQEVRDAPLGCDWSALLPPGVKSVYAKLCWKDADALRSSGGPNPDTKRKRNVTIIDADPSPPPILKLETDSSQTTVFAQTDDTTSPTDPRTKQKERLKAEKEADIKTPQDEDAH